MLPFDTALLNTRPAHLAAPTEEERAARRLRRKARRDDSRAALQAFIAQVFAQSPRHPAQAPAE